MLKRVLDGFSYSKLTKRLYLDDAASEGKSAARVLCSLITCSGQANPFLLQSLAKPGLPWFLTRTSRSCRGKFSRSTYGTTLKAWL